MDRFHFNQRIAFFAARFPGNTLPGLLLSGNASFLSRSGEAIELSEHEAARNLKGHHENPANCEKMVGKLGFDGLFPSFPTS